ncbi:antibiotic biosynthesis monooxygenase [Aureococcus anophagefferens]|nr:antibiotic biosynthesis monooxygenase [Aureococcus anophagefferens]
MVDANAMDATLARSERLSMYQLRCDAREREVAELEARSRLPRDVLELPAAPLADVRSSYENLSNVAAVKVRPPPSPARDDARDAQAENDELRRRLDALEAARCRAAARAARAGRARAGRARASRGRPAARARGGAPRRAAADARALARLEMSTHRERQWQRIYVSR